MKEAIRPPIFKWAANGARADSLRRALGPAVLALGSRRCTTLPASTR